MDIASSAERLGMYKTNARIANDAKKKAHLHVHADVLVVVDRTEVDLRIE